MKMPEEIKKGLECRIRGTSEKCKYHCDECDLYIRGYSLENVIPMPTPTSSSSNQLSVK